MPGHCGPRRLIRVTDEAMIRRRQLMRTFGTDAHLVLSIVLQETLDTTTREL